MRITNPLVLIFAIALAACGSEEQPPASQTASAERPNGSSGKQRGADAAQEMTAEQVAKEARGKVKCPAKVASPKPKINAAVDVAGVWPGMTYDEAANVVLCTHELLIVGPTGRTFEIQT